MPPATMAASRGKPPLWRCQRAVAIRLVSAMPSWNVHNAHVERLLEGREARMLGICDENAFLFGSYVPDVYVGFMVPEASTRIDYCITHVAMPNSIPVPEADRFWDQYIACRFPRSPAGRSLVLGAWAHLVADRVYNGSFREFVRERDLPVDEELRQGKQGDFDLFGRSLGIARLVEATPELVEAAWDFRPYRIGAEDVARTAVVANGIVRDAARTDGSTGEYRLLDERWLAEVFQACDERLATWLEAWQRLCSEGRGCLAADVRAFAPVIPRDSMWQA